VLQPAGRLLGVLTVSSRVSGEERADKFLDAVSEDGASIQPPSVTCCSLGRKKGFQTKIVRIDIC
jgi:hypothetical protein